MTENEQRIAAGEVAGRSELLDVRLISSQVSTPDIADPSVSLQFEFDGSPTVHSEDGSGEFVVSVAYRLTVTQESEGEEGAGESQVAELEFHYAALFSHDSSESFSDSALEAFAKTTGSFAIYPYAREYVQDVTSRLGLPPLTLGLFKLTPEDFES